MAKVKFAGNDVETCGVLPPVGIKAPGFSLTTQDLSEITLDDLKGKQVVLNIFPSLDTEVCAASVRRFNVDAAKFADTVVLCVSKDLPFAATRFCTANGIENVKTASGFRSDFGREYGVEIVDGPLKGLYARSIVVIDKEGKVKGSQMVDEITNEPDYAAAEALLG
ncbi:MAG: thiol peroxidase [Bacteroidales bacterium]|nr:thiol peroxidase [Bacteroidales bacterium]MDE7466350.1 thiol peroxidase [Muribaculaceae bacterium]